MLNNTLITRTPSDDEIRRHLPLVVRIATHIHRRLPPNVQRDDLIAAGMRGLVDALRTHGGDHGETFLAYARIRVRGAIIDELRSQDWSPRTRDHERVSVVRHEDLSPEEQASSDVDDAADASQLLERFERLQQLRDAVAKLPERERTVLQMRYFDGVGLREIGEQLSISGPRVSQLHSRAVQRLREALEG